MTSAERPAVVQVLDWIQTDYDLQAPEAFLEDDGDVSLDWMLASGEQLSVSVSDDGVLTWAILIPGTSAHGIASVRHIGSELSAAVKRFERCSAERLKEV